MKARKKEADGDILIKHDVQVRFETAEMAEEAVSALDGQELRGPKTCGGFYDCIST